MNSGSYTYVSGYLIGTRFEGSHTLKLKIDTTNAVDEANELDNEYTKPLNVYPPRANLAEYVPSGWSRSIILSNVPGTNSDSSILISTDTVYVDWAIRNKGGRPTEARFAVELRLDGVLQKTWWVDPPLAPGSSHTVADYALGNLSPVPHTVQLKIDAQNDVFEGIAPKETDNIVSRTFNVAAGKPDLVPELYPGWSAVPIISVYRGANSSTPYADTSDPLYLSWCIANCSGVATEASFRTELFLDGASVDSWTTNAPFDPSPPGTSYKRLFCVYDYPLGTLSAGPHAVVLAIDAADTVDEQNEQNNTMGERITVTGTTCSYAIVPSEASYDASAGTGVINVGAPSGCQWTAASNASWITILSGSTGSSVGTVSYSIQANTAAGSRTGTITVAGKTFTVTQAGAGCSYSLQPASRSHGAEAAAGSVTVETQAGCAWTAAASAGWLAIVSGASGSGSGSFSYSVEANTGTASRTGTITVAGKTFTVTQAGTSCSYSLQPASRSHGAEAAAGSVTVETQAGCAWTAASGASWLTISSGTSGTGAGSVEYSVQANTGTASRTGTITVAGKRFTVTQSAPCTYSIMPSQRGHGIEAGTGNINVTAPAGCTWRAGAVVPWIGITSGQTGSGAGTVSYSLDANENRDSRVGTIIIAGITFTVTQAGLDQARLRPVITDTSPQRVVAGSPRLILNVTGTGFATGAAIRWDGWERTTTALGMSQLRIVISAQEIASPGEHEMAVVNPGGVSSAPIKFAVLPSGIPAPRLVSLRPSSMGTSGSAFSLKAVGRDFVQGSRLRWNGSDRPTVVESSTHLTALIGSWDIGAPEIAKITVYTPRAGESNALDFEIRRGSCVTEISPSVIPQSGGSYILSLFGLDSGGAAVYPGLREPQGTAVVTWNGTALQTEQGASGELRAEVPASLASAATSASVTVRSGGTTWNTFLIRTSGSNPAPLVTGLSPAGSNAGALPMGLTVRGRDFVRGATILWNGASRQTVFVDSTELRTVIEGRDIENHGASSVSVLNPAPGGGESNRLTFRHVASLFFPQSTRPGAQEGGRDPTEYVGLAVVNPRRDEAGLMFTAFDSAGEPLKGQQVTNPARRTLSGWQQLPSVDFEVFGRGLLDGNPAGWFKLETASGDIPGFFLTFDADLNVLDGADVSASTMESAVLPALEQQGFTRIHIINPGITAATVLFELVGADGGPLGSAATRNVGASALVVEDVRSLFPGVIVSPADYVRATANRPLVFFEVLGRPGAWVQALNGQDAAGGGARLYSPQYAVGPDWRTEIVLVNLDPRPAIATMRLIGDDGRQIGPVREFPIAARGKLHLTDQGIFADAPEVLAQGHLEITSDGSRLSGSVAFGDPARNRFSAVLPLVANLASELILGQLASDESYYTGIAVLNPQTSAVDVTIRVLDDAGREIGSKTVTLQPGSRTTGLVTEYCPSLRGLALRKGYIRVHASDGIACFALFGTARALSAVPAQVIGAR